MLSLPSDVVYCFIDTNILIHFRMFDEIDWLTKIQANHVCLVIAPTVMAELNKHKDDNTKRWRQKRARKLITKLRGILQESPLDQPIEIRQDVCILDLSIEPKVDWKVLGLDPGVNDDRLLASVVEFVNGHPKADVRLITDDFLAERKATYQNITVIRPEGLIEKIERLSPEEDEIRRLKRELEQLKRRIPELRFSFWEDNQSVNKVNRSLDIHRENPSRLEEIARKLDAKKLYLEETIARAKRRQISDREISKFSQDYQKYINELDLFLNMERSREYGQRTKLAFILENIGSMPAIDVEIELRFPEGTYIVSADEDNDDIFFDYMEPHEPTPEWNKEIDFPGLFSSSVALSTPHNPPKVSKPKGPMYSGIDRSVIYYEHPKLRNKQGWHLNPIFAYPPPESGNGFKIHYYIHADNLINPIEGELNVAFQ